MAKSTAARRKVAAAQADESPEWREEMIVAVTRLNRSKGGGLHWWTPTDLWHELEGMEALRRGISVDEVKIPRSTIGMRMRYMRAENIIAFEHLTNAGPIVGTPGFRYGLIGTPPSGDSRVVANEDELEQRALTLARTAAAAAAEHKPKRRTKSRVASGRVLVTTTARAQLWQRAQQKVLGQGTPKKDVLDTILERYLADEEATQPSGDAYQRTSRYLPRTSRPASALA